MEIKKNDIIKLNIESCDLSGNGVGRYEGRVIFVPRAAAGDELFVRILKVKPNLAYGRIEHIITPSSDRAAPLCPVYGKCGGCVFGHLSYEAELEIKYNHVKQCFKRIGGIEPEFEGIKGSDSVYSYRNKAQFPVSVAGGELNIGFYAGHSHRVVNCPRCVLQPDEFGDILESVSSFIKEYGVSVYDEEKHTGIIRHIFLRKGTVSGEIMVCAVINADKLPYEKEFCEAVLSSCSAVKSIIVNINKKDTNVVLGERCRTIYGAGYINDTLCGVNFQLSPLSFYQINHDQAEYIYGKAAEYAGLKNDDVLIDLYCGTGTIGLSMADKVKKLIGIEIVPQAVEDAKRNAINNNITNADFICADASSAAQELRKQGVKPDVVMLDPPRKGCDARLIETVCEMAPGRVVYISCNPATLARDCREFAEHGYIAGRVTAADMFPRTGHVETVALLVKLPPDDVIKVKLDVSELPVSIHDGDATYPEIKAYVEKQFGLKVSSLYISQIKRKFGLTVTDSYNKPKSDNSRHPICPPDKEKAIAEALRFFKMID